MPRQAQKTGQRVYLSDALNTSFLGQATDAPKSAHYMGIDNILQWHKAYPHVCYCEVCKLPFAVTNKRTKNSEYVCASDMLKELNKNRGVRSSEAAMEAAAAVESETQTEAAAVNGNRPRRTNGKPNEATADPAAQTE